jgi:hypothetical protein
MISGAVDGARSQRDKARRWRADAEVSISSGSGRTAAPACTGVTDLGMQILASAGCASEPLAMPRWRLRC